MPEMPDVATLTTISSNWGNMIRSRTVQRYSSVANRTSEHPSPGEGDLSYLEDANAVEVYDGTSWVRVGSPAGAIEAFGGSSAPSGWLLCDGTAVSRTTFAALFSVLGTTYGAGNGSTTFNLPNLQQRFPLGKAAAGTGSTLGSTGGSIDHSHTGPSHTHDNQGTNSTGAHRHTSTMGGASTIGAGGTLFAAGGTAHTHDITGTQMSFDGNHAHTQGPTVAGGTGNTGTNNPPFQVVNYIVKT